MFSSSVPSAARRPGKQTCIAFERMQMKLLAAGTGQADIMPFSSKGYKLDNCLPQAGATNEILSRAQRVKQDGKGINSPPHLL